MKNQRNEQEDLKKLASAFYKEICFDDSCEYGSIGTDCKRPFGNSDVEEDILTIIGWGSDGSYSHEQIEYAKKLYCELLVPFLKEQWRIYISEIQPYASDGQEMAITPLDLLKSVLEAAIDNHLECMNRHLEENKGYLHTLKNKTLLELYETEKNQLEKLNNWVNNRTGN